MLKTFSAVVTICVSNDLIMWYLCESECTPLLVWYIEHYFSNFFQKRKKIIKRTNFWCKDGKKLHKKRPSWVLLIPQWRKNS